MGSSSDITLLAGSTQTGLHSAAYRIYGSLLNIPIAIFSAVLPVMASFGEKREGVRGLFDRSVGSILAIAAAAMCTNIASNLLLIPQMGGPAPQ